MEGALGSRVLREVEEVSLEKVLDGWATSRLGKSHVKHTHIPELDSIALRHFEATKAPVIAIGGRQLPLVYRVASTLVSSPHHFALLIVDLDGRFDPSRLSCTKEDARHVYVQRPAQQNNPAGGENPESPAGASGPVKADADVHMLYGAATAASATRQWWGTILAGGLGPGDLTAGWKGWLRVDREKVPGFPLGISVERALEQREARQAVVDTARWSADSLWGGFAFDE